MVLWKIEEYFIGKNHNDTSFSSNYSDLLWVKLRLNPSTFSYLQYKWEIRKRPTDTSAGWSCFKYSTKEI